MKRAYQFLTFCSVALALLLGGFSFSGCQDTCSVTNSYIEYGPVYLPMDSFYAEVNVGQARTLENPGRIFYNNGWLYINEQNQGIHVIDNRNPSNPNPVAFIAVPGTTNMVAKGNILYADHKTDLVLFDISNPTAPSQAGRVPGVFAESYWPQVWQDGDYEYYGYEPGKGIVIGYEPTGRIEMVENAECENPPSAIFARYEDDALYMYAESGANNLSAASGFTGNGDGGVSVSGSMAQFGIVGNYLYTLIGNYQLHTFNIASLENPEPTSEVVIGWGTETIFPYQDKLFFGAENGMHIYTLAGGPERPRWLSTYEHVRACDPVVIENNTAYVTLRSGTECQGFTNQLDVIDISNPASPALLKTHSMLNPHGLGINNGRLFICEGTGGLKRYTVQDRTEITLEQHLTDMHAWDVIVLNNLLLLTGQDGLYQFDYSNPESLELLSVMRVQNQN